MIAYFDTSALIPLLVQEPTSELAGTLWDSADRVVSATLVYAEARAALARARRLDRVDDAGLEQAVEELETLYLQLDRVTVDETLVRRAGAMAQQHRLRGYDALHLAAAEAVRDDDLVVVAGDAALCDAARTIELHISPLVAGRGRAIEVRDIRPADHRQVGEVLVDTYRASGPFDDDYLGFLARPWDWVAEATSVFVAEDQGRIVGVVAFTRPGDGLFEPAQLQLADCGFRFLAVDPAARGSGVGAALVLACVDAAHAHGCRRLLIYSMAFMTAAHRLYEREGFVRRTDLDVAFPAGAGRAFHLDLTADAADHFPALGPVPDAPPWFEDAWKC